MSSDAGIAPRLGRRVRYARQRAGLTFEQLGAAASIPTERLHNIENGIGPLSTLELGRIATVTDRSMELFLTAVDEGLLDLVGDAYSPATLDAIEWFDVFIRRYEWLESVSGDLGEPLQR